MLLQKGYKVRNLDDLSIGNQSNVDLLRNNPNYQFIKGDIRNLGTCLKATEGVDHLLRECAHSIEIPLWYEELNIKGTLNRLEAFSKKGAKKFIYASSSSVYGDEPNLPKQEGCEGNVLSPYVLIKKVKEESAKLYK